MDDALRSTAVVRPRLSVLIVEDDDEDFLIAQRLLADQDRWRFEVERAPTYDQALAMIAERRHDVYLVDYRLGAHTGLDLIRESFTDDVRPPVLLLTGHGDLEVDLEATQLGVTDYLVKDGLSAATLERSIRYAVSHHLVLDELRRNRERYALAVRGANDGIWDWDLVRGRVYFAPRWKAIAGYVDGEVGDSPEEWLERIHPDDSERVRAELDAHLEGRSPHFESEHRILHSDGGYRWVLSRGVAIRDDDGAATRMAGSMSNIGDRKAAEQQLVHDALHDGLTGLPNRALFLDRLEQSLKRAARDAEHHCAVLFLDLDRFKMVNDGFSHAVGDQLLVAAARRLAASLRPGDTVARIGGDEFTILLDGLSSVDEAREIAARTQTALGRPFRIEGRELVVTASVGIALSADGSPSEELLRNADIAMYNAKRRGTDRQAIFNTSMHKRVVTRLRLETELREAIETGALRVFYQPIVELETGALRGFEALARWPVGTTLVTPGEFIPVAEETGLIGPLGAWVLGTATRDLATWHAQGLTPLTVTVNLSTRQLEDPDFPIVVATALATAGIAPESLCLELTESALMGAGGSSLDCLNLLKDLGIYVGIDDFGTGHSSLARLKSLPVEVLKVDRSFVDGLGTEPEDSAVVAAVLSLAHALGLHVIAEGVETPLQAHQLSALGCAVAQGWLWSPAVPADQIPAQAQLGTGAHPDVASHRGERSLVMEMMHQLGIAKEARA
jgi:diguanylate cyclase (GGDEF)-like protein/PAS domain S-box-containing protein